MCTLLEFFSCQWKPLIIQTKRLDKWSDGSIHRAYSPVSSFKSGTPTHKAYRTKDGRHELAQILYKKRFRGKLKSTFVQQWPNLISWGLENEKYLAIMLKILASQYKRLCTKVKGNFHKLFASCFSSGQTGQFLNFTRGANCPTLNLATWRTYLPVLYVEIHSKFSFQDRREERFLTVSTNQKIKK